MGVDISEMKRRHWWLQLRGYLYVCCCRAWFYAPCFQVNCKVSGACRLSHGGYDGSVGWGADLLNPFAGFQKAAILFYLLASHRIDDSLTVVGQPTVGQNLLHLPFSDGAFRHPAACMTGQVDLNLRALS